MPKPSEIRRKQLAAIHVGKTQLGLDDDQYRDLLEDWTGKRSAAKLAPNQLALVIQNLRKMGFQRPELPHVEQQDDPEIAKIKALWIALHDRKAITDGSEEALNKWIKRQTGVSHYRWLYGDHVTRAIESLKQWHDRLDWAGDKRTAPATDNVA